MGRENGVIRLFAGLEVSSVTVNTSTALLLGDVHIGGRAGFNDSITQTYCGAAHTCSKSVVGQRCPTRRSLDEFYAAHRARRG